MHEAVAPGARHARIHLGNHPLGIFHTGTGNIHRNSQATIPDPIRRADLNQGHVQSDLIAGEQVGDLGQVNRNVIDFALESGLPHATADKKQL